MNRSRRLSHPDAASLRRFVLGQLRGELMRQVERHMTSCDICVKAALAVPHDHLVGLLRRPVPDSCADSPAPHALASSRAAQG